jgi:hypothetical protein
MTKPSSSRYAEALIAVGISMSGFIWTAFHLRLYHDGTILDRLGVFSAVLCVTAAPAVSWGWLVSLLSRSLDWEPPACRLAALLILVPGFFILAESTRLQAISLVLYLMTLAQLTAGRLAFPGKSDAEFREPSKPVTFSAK